MARHRHDFVGKMIFKCKNGKPISANFGSNEFTFLFKWSLEVFFFGHKFPDFFFLRNVSLKKMQVLVGF